MPSRKRKILCVDDDADVRLMLTLFFGQHGYEVTAVSSSQGRQFIDAEESFDLYILGTGLAGTESAAFCRKIRESDRHTLIIIYVEATSESVQDDALRTGGVVFIAKPHIDKLLDVVKAVLEFRI